MIKLDRSIENPILTPINNPWENLLVFNPGATVKGDNILLIYRALGKDDFHSRLGIAVSTDGIHFKRQEEPLYYGGNHEYETLGIEDPRVVNIEDTYYITYTAISEDLQAEINPDWKEKIAKRPRIALSTTKDFINFLDYDVIVPNLSGKNSSFFPKKVNGQYCILYRAGVGKTLFSTSDRIDYFPEGKPVFEERPGLWDNKRVGIGAPPIETEKGWLMFYHGVDEQNVYRLGIMFLDLLDPTKILYRSPFPVLEPETSYEKYGFIPNVVFTCGAVEKGDKYFIYYGAADQVIGLATIEKKLVLNLF